MKNFVLGLCSRMDCETGEKADDNRVGACPGFPLDKVPSNPTSACFAYNGTCYKCNPDRGSDCSQEWLWKYSFNYSNWWYTQVVCNDPYEEEDEGEFFAEGCLDESLLKKQSNEVFKHNEVAISYSANFLQLVKKYDVLGRRGINKRPSHMALYQKNMGISQPEIETSVILQIPSMSSVDYCDRDSLGMWTCNTNKKTLKKKSLVC